jgi:hypothetical protein
MIDAIDTVLLIESELYLGNKGSKVSVLLFPNLQVSQAGAMRHTLAYFQPS